jgi:iron transport multicopper oxidase
LQSLFDVVPSTLNPNVTGWLVYDDSAPKPKPALVDSFTPFDDITLVPEDGMELLKHPNKRVRLDLAMNNLGDGAN